MLRGENEHSAASPVALYGPRAQEAEARSLARRESVRRAAADARDAKVLLAAHDALTAQGLSRFHATQAVLHTPITTRIRDAERKLTNALAARGLRFEPGF
jgi:hypothetical protein